MFWFPRHTLRVAFVGLSLLGAGAYGADAPAPAEAKPAAPEIQPIAPAEIPIRADVDERFVQDVMARARQPDPAAKLVAPLDELTAGISKLSQTFKRDELKSLPAIRLESLDRHWDFYLVQLKAWRNDLQAITARYSEDAAELAKRRVVWEATRTAALGSGLPPALDERMGQILAAIDAAEEALSIPLDSQLRLAQRSNTVQQAAEAGKKAVTSAIAYFDRRLFTVDAPPLWQAWTDRTPSQKGVDTMLVGLAIERDFLAEYNTRYHARLRVLNIAALLLLPLMFWLSARSRKLVSDDADLKSSAQVLLRPISAWLVLVLVGVLFFEPDAPMIRHETALLLALVPILRLLPKAAYRALGPWPYILTALYLLDELGFLLVGSPLLHRLHTFAIGTLALGATLWLLLRGKGRAKPEDKTSRSAFVRVMAWLAAGALVAALLANLVGNTSLAEVLTSGVLDSGYVALAFFAIALVLGAMLKMLLARRGMTRFRVVTQHAGPLLKSTGRLLNVAAFVAWLFVMLNEFRVYRPVEKFVTTVLTYPLEAGKISVTLGSVLLFMASIWVAFWLARTIRVVLRDDVLPNMDLPRGVGNSVATLTYYAVMTLGVMVALAAAGFQVSQLAFVVGALGVGIGFGLQNVVNNFVSGLILMFERPIQPGDVVEVSGTSGKVREIGMRATTLSTFEGADVVVPNGMLLNEKLINWTLSDMDRRIDVNVGVAYGTDPNRVLQLLMEVTRSTDGIANTPEPTVLFVGFGANSLDFSIRSWTNDFDNWVKIRSALTVRVHDALKDAGIVIPFPQHDLHLRSVSPGASAALAGLNKPPVPPTNG